MLAHAEAIGERRPMTRREAPEAFGDQTARDERVEAADEGQDGIGRHDSLADEAPDVVDRDAGQIGGRTDNAPVQRVGAGKEPAQDVHVHQAVGLGVPKRSAHLAVGSA